MRCGERERERSQLLTKDDEANADAVEAGAVVRRVVVVSGRKCWTTATAVV